jgi:phosphoglycolate phosphatase-like HAD superfamily hydrolase
MKNLLFQNVNAFFLDFDGVVIESADIKTEAFYEIYLPFGQEIALKAKDYHLKFQGVNRSEKFKEIHKIYLGREISTSETQAFSAKFSDIVLNKIMACPLVDGVKDFLEKQQEDGIPVFLLSATPHEELIFITEGKGLSAYFKELYGSPWKKPEAGEEIINTYGFSRDKIVFIGDSTSDLEAATKLKTRFLGRVLSKTEHIFGNHPIIENFYQLL